MVEAFTFYSVLTTLPYILNKINVIKVVMVMPGLFKLDKHSHIIQEHFNPYILMLIKVIWAHCNVIYVTF